MLNILLICVGGLKEKYWKDAAAEYLKRLDTYAKVTVAEVAEEHLPARPSESQIEAGLCREGRKIASLLPKSAYVTALCVEGGQMPSTSFADAISLAAQRKGTLVFLIGGSFGLSEEIKAKADLKLSLSQMTFPHMAARILLLEQLYRAMNILGGGRYHK